MSTPELGLYSRMSGAIGAPMCGVLLIPWLHALLRLSVSRNEQPGYSGLRRAGLHVDVVTPECRYGPCVCHGAVLACRCKLQVNVRYVYCVAQVRLCSAPVLDVLDWCWMCGAPECGGMYQDE